MVASTLPRRKVRAYGIEASASPPSGPPNYYWFGQDGERLVASLYRDGIWQADRGEVEAQLPEDPQPVLLASDSRGAVGPGALAWVADRQTLRVWDVEAGALATYATGGDVLTGLGYRDGFLWWIEREPGFGTPEVRYRLVRAGCDLQDVALVSEHVGSALVTADWHLPTAFLLTPSAAILADSWVDAINGEIDGVHKVRMPLSGGLASDVDTGFRAGERILLGLPAGSTPGSFFALGDAGETGELRRHPEELEQGSAADSWPVSVPWALQGRTYFSVSADGSEIALGGRELTLPERPVLLRDRVQGPWGERPRQRFVIEPHPEIGSAGWLFVKD